jgi:hypothetical protein
MADSIVSIRRHCTAGKEPGHRDSVVEQGMRRHEAWKKGQEGTTGRLTLLTGAEKEGDK